MWKQNLWRGPALSEAEGTPARDPIQESKTKIPHCPRQEGDELGLNSITMQEKSLEGNP